MLLLSFRQTLTSRFPLSSRCVHFDLPPGSYRFLNPMIELTRTHEVPTDWRVKVLGVGGAGTHAVDRLNRDGLSGVELLVANTDARALNTAFTPERISLGQALTRGLGAGGDPELGRTAALESIAAVGERLMGASLVILMVGLGGGTGSGAAPCIARIARDQGAHVAVFATLPFSFEGRRRREQALEALDALQGEADLVICFENDRMSSVTDPASGIEDAFAAVDSLLAQSVRALAAMTRRRNVLHSGLDEIAATVAGHRGTALFGYGAADGEERALAAVARAFSNPLLNFDGALESISSLWVYVAGGPDLRFSEVQSLMGEVSARLPHSVRLYFGAAVDPQMGGAVSVTLLAGVPSKEFPTSNPAPRAFSGAVASVAAPVPQPVTRVAHDVVEVSAASEPPLPAPPEQPWNSGWEETTTPRVTAEPEFHSEAVEQAVVEPSSEQEPPQTLSRSLPIPPFELSKERRREAAPNPVVQPPPETVVDHRTEPSPVEGARAAQDPLHSVQFSLDEAVVPDPVPAPAPVREQRPQEVPAPAQEPVARRAKENVQEQMRFEPVNRGRFEKTDPTIVDGEDLDVPTFMRQKVSLEP